MLRLLIIDVFLSAYSLSKTIESQPKYLKVTEIGKKIVLLPFQAFN